MENKLTYNEIILNILRDKFWSQPLDKAWEFGFNFQAQDTEYGWLGPTARRRCQELAQEGKIEVQMMPYKDRLYAAYRYIPSDNEKYLHQTRFTKPIPQEASQQLI